MVFTFVFSYCFQFANSTMEKNEKEPHGAIPLEEKGCVFFHLLPSLSPLAKKKPFPSPNSQFPLQLMPGPLKGESVCLCVGGEVWLWLCVWFYFVNAT